MQSKQHMISHEGHPHMSFGLATCCSWLVVACAFFASAYDGVASKPSRVDLSITKTVDNPAPSSGDTITYTLTVANAGPDTATGVEVTDLLPENLTFNSSSSSQGAYDNMAGLWIVGTLASNNGAMLTLKVTAENGGAATNTAVITADQKDSNTDNNSDSIVITVACTLTIVGNPAEQGVSSPYGYGSYLVTPSTVITNTITSPADEANGMRYVLSGWTGSGSVPASGTTNIVTFTITEDSTLTWNWVTEYWLDTTAGPNGTVDIGDGWHLDGTQVTITASPDANYYFVKWTGDVPEGKETSNPLTVTIDQTRSITAYFLLPATYYVSPTGSDANNGTSWAFAKQTIQAGINVATSADTILVADGTYGPITITPGITVRSVNGAQATTINGGGVTRCAYLSTNAVLDGFTVTNGSIGGCSYGGGVFVYRGTVQNCTISGNTAGYAGGGVYVFRGTVQNCTISGNTAPYGWPSAAASYGGGGVYADYSTVQNCTISGNTAPYGYPNIYPCGGGVYASGGTVQNCTISGNWAFYGGGVYGSTVQNCMISGNTGYFFGGGVHGCTVEDCAISENYSAYYGGGVYCSMVQNCMISGNTATWGGGVCGGGTVQNCTISGNRAFSIFYGPDYGWGGGVYGNTTLRNCTISGNSASAGCGGVHATSIGSTGTVQNCIAYYNQNGDVNGAISYISYSCIGTNIAGVGNITNEPQFVSTGTGYGTNHVPGDYRLRPTSPCINMGTNQSWMTSAVDLDGGPRVLGGVVDMGAYEWSGTNITIMRSPAILSSRCGYGSNATGQTIEIWNAGTGAMAYALWPNVSWLSLSPTDGTSEGETDLVSVHYWSAGLAPGSYTGIVTITSAEASNSPQVVTVYLWVDKLDLSMTKTVDYPAPVTGDTVTYTLALVNAGPDTATGVEVTDLLPESVTFNSSSASQGAYDNLSGLWTVGTLAPNGTATLYVNVTVATGGVATNTAVITADQVDLDTGNNSDSAVITVPYTFTVAGSPAEHGVPTPYAYGSHTVSHSAVITDSVFSPADEANGTRYTVSGWTGAGSVPASGNTNVVSFTIGQDSTLTWNWDPEYWLDTFAGPNGTVDIKDGWHTDGSQVTITATPDANYYFIEWTGDVPEGSENSNVLTLTMDQARSITANFNVGVDLGVTKSVDNPAPSIGDTVTYTIDVTNLSTNTATGVELTDLLPGSTLFNSASASQGSYDSTSGVWTVGTLALNGTARLTINVTVYSWVALVNSIRSPNREGDNFGYSVCSIGDSMFVVGEPADDEGASSSGSVYLYDTNGTLLAFISNPEPAYSDNFGYSVSGIGTSMFVVGTPYDDPGGVGNAGSVYLYDTGGTLLASIPNPEPGSSDYFGASVCGVGSNMFVVGAYYDDPDGVSCAGSVYLYDTSGTLLASIPNPEPGSSDYFGWSISGVGNNMFVVGAYRDYASGVYGAGSVYLYCSDNQIMAA